MYTIKYYSTMRKKEISPSVMELEGIMLSDITEKEKEKYCVISFICSLKQSGS